MGNHRTSRVVKAVLKRGATMTVARRGRQWSAQVSGRRRAGPTNNPGDSIMSHDNQHDTVGEHFLLTLLQAGQPQEPIDLLVAAFAAYKHIFGLEGYRTQHPDARLLD